MIVKGEINGLAIFDNPTKFFPVLVVFLSSFLFSVSSLNDYVASKVFPFIGKLFPSLFISR